MLKGDSEFLVSFCTGVAGDPRRWFFSSEVTWDAPLYVQSTQGYVTKGPVLENDIEKKVEGTSL